VYGQIDLEVYCTLDIYLGVWIDRSGGILYGMASKITFICQMNFNAFPVDIQVFFTGWEAAIKKAL